MTVPEDWGANAKAGIARRLSEQRAGSAALLRSFAESPEATAALRAEGIHPAMLVSPPEATWQALYRHAAETADCCGQCARDIAPEEPVWLRRTTDEEYEPGEWRSWVWLPHCSNCGPWRMPDTREVSCVICARPVMLSRAYAEKNSPYYSRVYNYRGRAWRFACCGAHRRERDLTARRKPPASRSCEECGDVFTPKRSTARFCSTKCRVAAHRAVKVRHG